MGKFRAKDFFTLICTLAAIATSVIIVLTFLTTYHFINIMPIFNSYLLLQIGICLTMALWAIRFFIYRSGREKYIYSSICIIISVVSLFFIINLVK
ncbi:hypothetical protein A500_00765 [Clostridium sartagoforme AAU1]|jgi:hypothetical protein|uniref:Uncharacterized protein n=1 Tax=Clostridium sartagoforme AAU1 TaxID=1202534 RepID=R9CLS2_9CLOT|nr:hypothetical protein [Clostridium sartagoforme]EOR28131.1 hypothetical protein A500_00765 [Clostridium sartagoforme AAU1]